MILHILFLLFFVGGGGGRSPRKPWRKEASQWSGQRRSTSLAYSAAGCLFHASFPFLFKLYLMVPLPCDRLKGAEKWSVIVEYVFYSLAHLPLVGPAFIHYYLSRDWLKGRTRQVSGMASDGQMETAVFLPLSRLFSAYFGIVSVFLHYATLVYGRNTFLTRPRQEKFA